MCVIGLECWQPPETSLTAESATEAFHKGYFGFPNILLVHLHKHARTVLARLSILDRKATQEIHACFGIVP